MACLRVTTCGRCACHAACQTVCAGAFSVTVANAAGSLAFVVTVKAASNAAVRYVKCFAMHCLLFLSLYNKDHKEPPQASAFREKISLGKVWGDYFNTSINKKSRCFPTHFILSTQHFKASFPLLRINVPYRRA